MGCGASKARQQIEKNPLKEQNPVKEPAVHLTPSQTSLVGKSSQDRPVVPAVQSQPEEELSASKADQAAALAELQAVQSQPEEELSASKADQAAALAEAHAVAAEPAARSAAPRLEPLRSGNAELRPRSMERQLPLPSLGSAQPSSPADDRKEHCAMTSSQAVEAAAALAEEVEPAPHKRRKGTQRPKWKSDEIEEAAAALRMQQYYRGYAVRAMHTELVGTRNAAAARLQCIYRGHALRSELDRQHRRELAVAAWAAVLMQKFYRGRLVRGESVHRVPPTGEEHMAVWLEGVPED